MAQGRVTIQRQDKVAILTLDRPERGNAIDEAMATSLGEAVTALEGDVPRAVVLTGAGPDSFCAGLDIRPEENPIAAGLLSAVKARAGERVRELLGRVREPVDRLVGLPVPVIAAVNGLAFGAGAELAVRCDLRVADAGSTFCFINTRLGLMTSLGGGPTLARLVGPARAADLLLTARKVQLTEAYGLGLVNRPSQPGQATEDAVQLAQTIAANGPRAVRSTVTTLRRFSSPTLAEDLEAELEAAAKLFASGEFAYGIQAARSKEGPEFPDLP